MTEPNSQIAPTGRTKFFRRWRRRLIFLVVLAVLGYAFRGTLLPAVATILIYEDQPATATRAVILSGDRRFDRATQLLNEKQVEGILIVETAHTRIEKEGIVLSSTALNRKELNRRGVGDEKTEIVHGNGRHAWALARQLGGWLDNNPESTVIVLVDRFQSRQIRIAFRQALSEEKIGRIRFTALVHREQDESNWWHNKDGAVAFGHSFLSLAHVWLIGEPDPMPELMSADELEARAK